MPVTTLDPTTALIVIDLQAGIVGLPLAHPVDGVIARAVSLARAFRDRQLPVVLVNVAGTPSGRTDADAGGGGRTLPVESIQLISELDQQPGDILVTKRARSAFTETGLTEHLRALGVTQVVLAGISTSSGVESTARHAHEHGFNVTLAVDAMTDGKPESHDHSVATIFPRIGETGTTQEILDLLRRSRS